MINSMLEQLNATISQRTPVKKKRAGLLQRTKEAMLVIIARITTPSQTSNNILSSPSLPFPFLFMTWHLAFNK